MIKYSALVCALVLVATCATVNSQSPSDQGPQNPLPICNEALLAAGEPCQQNTQNPQSDCSEALLAPGEQCPQNSQNPQQLPGLNRYTVNPQMGTQFGDATRGNLLDNQTRQGTYPNQQNAPGLTQPPPRQLPPERPTEFQKFTAETTGELLPVYGENLFRSIPSTFAPNDHGPVPPQYIVGPEDEILLRIWGQINYSGTLRVDRSGAIYVPQVGVVQVGGMPFSALDQHVRAAVAKLYRNFDLSVNIGKIRSIQIYVSGRARKPGAYTVSSLSTLVDALFATGGPAPQGSLRHILLNRDGKTIADFDLYGLLLHGDKSKDVHLLAEDVIYIQPAGPQVAITGSVRTPGVFEITDKETIANLIEMAGGKSSTASNARISVDRVEQQQFRQVVEFAFDKEGLASPLADGDIVRVFSILPAYRKTVTLRGNLANPGRFGWHPGMRLSDLIPDRDSLVSRDYWWKRSHLGLPSAEFEPSISPTSRLAEALAPPSQTPDQQTSRNQTGRNGTIASEVSDSRTSQADAMQPRRNEIMPTEPQLNWNYAVVERVDKETLKPSLIPFNLGKLVLDHDTTQNLELQPGDIVTIFSQTDVHVPIDEQVKYIELAGEVVHSGYYSVQPGESLRDIVERAGGLTTKAYLYGSEFTRNSTRILQQQRLDEYLRTISLEAERGTQALAVSSTSSAGAAAEVQASREVTKSMIERLSQLKATGRIVLPFQPGDTSTSNVPELALENGDRFVIPFKPSVVNVVGAVYDQNSFVFQPGHSVNYYLDRAGGSNRNADWGHAFIIRADGSVDSRKHMKGSGFFKASFENQPIFAGDTLVVPDKTLRPTALRGIIDWSQVFAQLALGAAAISVL